MKLLVMSAIVLSFCFSGFAQKTTAPRISTKSICRASQKLVDAKLPMVFLSVVRRATVKAANISENSDRVFFKLTNNFCSPIRLDMSGEVEGWGEASLYYVTEDGHSGQRLSGTLFCHVCSNNPLSPGRSVMFSIPFSDIDRGALMKIAYEFDFDRSASYESSNTLHAVTYYFRGLPESILRQSIQ